MSVQIEIFNAATGAAIGQFSFEVAPVRGDIIFLPNPWGRREVQQCQHGLVPPAGPAFQYRIGVA